MNLSQKVLVLKGLIAINIFLVFYNVLTIHSNTTSSNTSPCIVITDNSNNSQKSESNSRLTFKETFSDNLNEENKQQIIESNKQIPNDNNLDPIWWTTETRGSYTVLNNYIPSVEKSDTYMSITLTTQGTSPFLYHIEKVCQRWDGHVSVAVYAPGLDFPLVVNLIHYLRKCKHICVKTKTSWHLIYDTEFGPHTNTPFPLSYVKDEDLDCSLTFENISNKFHTSFRSDHSLPYPINVARNVARLNARTKYIFSSDIELYPSVGIFNGFLQLMEREEKGLIPVINRNNRHVYVIPVFEVQKEVKPPFNKSQLSQLVKSGKAIFFHEIVCDSCHTFPNRKQWFNTNPINNSLSVFRVTQHLKNRRAWEPIYIGTNAEPLYEEGLTWDGRLNKMSQTFEMCLLSYDFVILDNAFLVHAPGIKGAPVWESEEEKKRIPFMKVNKIIYNSMILKLKQKYGSNNKC